MGYTRVNCIPQIFYLPLSFGLNCMKKSRCDVKYVLQFCHEKIMKITRVLLLLFIIGINIGCSSTKSKISLNDCQISTIQKKPKNSCYIVGIIITESLAKTKARSISSVGNMVYDFEFNVGSDISKTLPCYLSNFLDIRFTSNPNANDSTEFVIVPKVTNALTITIRGSGAPSYDLLIQLEITIIHKGKIHNILTSSIEKHVDIPATRNTDSLRNIIMEEEYRKQIQELYNNIEQKIMIFLAEDNNY